MKKRVKTIISDMGLREQNVPFIDDNHLNRKEVLQSRLEGFVKYDKLHPDGEPYQIRSAYFDDMFDSYITENEDGTDCPI